MRRGKAGKEGEGDRACVGGRQIKIDSLRDREIGSLPDRQTKME